MSSNGPLYDHLEQLAAQMAPGGVDLFCAFSRFECAMKAYEFCRAGKSNVAEPDWDELAKHLDTEAKHGDFLKLIAEEGLVETLRRDPPKRQKAIIDGDQYRPEWQVADPPKNTKELLEAMRRVRNNLFHGGKSGTPDGKRDPLLIEDALALLNRILLAHHDLCFRFLNAEGT